MDTFDIFAVNAMLFSVLSMMAGIILQFSLKVKTDPDIMYEESSDALNENMYKMTIECNKFQPYHIHTYGLIEQALCSVLGIDNRGIIEVFYVAKMNFQIYIYLELRRSVMAKEFDAIEITPQKQVPLSKLTNIGEEGNDLNEMLKREITKRLNIRVGKKRIQVNSSQQAAPGEAIPMKSVSDMNISVEQISEKLSEQINSASSSKMSTLELV